MSNDIDLYIDKLKKIKDDIISKEGIQPLKEQIVKLEIFKDLWEHFLHIVSTAPNYDEELGESFLKVDKFIATYEEEIYNDFYKYHN